MMYSLGYPQKCDYISQHQWNISDYHNQIFPNLLNLTAQITLPMVDKEDELIWKQSATGKLTSKDSFLFKKQSHPKIPWAKAIWNKDVPPSKATMVLRLMMGKLPTDENLLQRGCNLPSMCSLCHNTEESSFQLFFECIYAVHIWCWLATTLNISL
jgi:hypothetical protein